MRVRRSCSRPVCNARHFLAYIASVFDYATEVTAARASLLGGSTGGPPNRRAESIPGPYISWVHTRYQRRLKVRHSCYSIQNTALTSPSHLSPRYPREPESRKNIRSCISVGNGV